MWEDDLRTHQRLLRECARTIRKEMIFISFIVALSSKTVSLIWISSSQLSLNAMKME